MNFLDLHPIDPREARFRLIATLFLLSELGVIASVDPRSATAGEPHGARPFPARRAARAGSRLVRPPRSC